MLDSNDRATEVVSTYGNMLYRISMMMLKNEHDVQDVMQETFIRYLQKAPLFRNREHEKAWLLRVNINLCKDFLRFHKRNNYISLEDLELAVPEPKQAEIVREIMQMPEKYKAVLLLHYVEGYRIKEIASILKTTEAAVKMRIQRGKGMLKFKMGDELYE